jgi:hypothetical protein
MRLNRSRLLPPVGGRTVGLLLLYVMMMIPVDDAARADVRVQGEPKAVLVEMNQTSIADVLSALTSAFDIQYRSSVALDENVNGTISGSLREVIAHLLEGYNYIVRGADTNQRFVIIIFGRRGDQAIPAPVPPLEIAKSPYANWKSSK